VTLFIYSLVRKRVKVELIVLLGVLVEKVNVAFSQESHSPLEHAYKMIVQNLIIESCEDAGYFLACNVIVLCIK